MYPILPLFLVWLIWMDHFTSSSMIFSIPFNQSQSSLNLCLPEMRAHSRILDGSEADIYACVINFFPINGFERHSALECRKPGAARYPAQCSVGPSAGTAGQRET
ncbi:hypothetical protein B0T19DRAFT_409287 [Cercophora scortea]|uniref:Secreted protein n=1 Tax=Cercophora scortea TaxID=314031 RepID=A0AAE0MKW2_9PEZI|nr:hypothetical protein B0T19DRAFT_409287 [Cercophora scortea]